MENANNTNETLKVALYIRVSTDEQVERFGIPLQKEALLALIKSRGKLAGGRDALIKAGETEEDYIYIDQGISGTIPLDERPAFGQLKEDIIDAPQGKRPFDIVAVYKIDRFARKLKVLLDVIDFFDKHGIKFISINENIDTSTPFGKAILGIIGVIAELELETIKLRTDGGKEQAVKNGVAMGSSASYGFEKDEDRRYKILEKEAKVVRMIFKMLTVDKQSVYQIAKYLKEHEYPSPGASVIINKKSAGEIRKKNPINFWRPERVRIILQNEKYIGDYYSEKTKGGKKVPKNEWKLSPYKIPQIIDLLTFEKAQRLLEELKHSRPETINNHTYLLSGLLRCDGCYNPDIDKEERIRWSGERKRLQKGNDRFTYFYRCGRKLNSKSGISCGVIPLPAEGVENYIIKQVKKLLANPIATYNHQLKLKSSQSEIKHLKRKQEDLIKLINALPNRKERLQEQHENGLMDINKLRGDIKGLVEKEKKHQKELKEIEYKISQNTLSQSYLESLNLFSKKYASGLDKISMDRKELYTLLHELIEEIVVYSRPVGEKDVIAGKRKKGQKIPYRLHIKLKLPQDILQDICSNSGQEFVSGGLGGIRTHDPLLAKQML